LFAILEVALSDAPVAMASYHGYKGDVAWQV
jgi:hypothetical protein